MDDTRATVGAPERAASAARSGKLLPVPPPSDAPRSVMRVLTHPAVQAAARLCLASPFLVAGLYKLVDWQAGEAEMARSGLDPAWLFNACVMVTELVGSALVISGRWLWLGAGALGVFTVLTTFIAHRFWTLTGSDAVSELDAFLEHAAIAAAFILVTTAARPRASRRLG